MVENFCERKKGNYTRCQIHIQIYFFYPSKYIYVFFFLLETCIKVGKKSLQNMIRDITYYEITTPPTYLKKY